MPMNGESHVECVCTSEELGQLMGITEHTDLATWTTITPLAVSANPFRSRSDPLELVLASRDVTPKRKSCGAAGSLATSSRSPGPSDLCCVNADYSETPERLKPIRKQSSFGPASPPNAFCLDTPPRNLHWKSTTLESPLPQQALLTPSKRRLQDTPPSGPRNLERRLQDDISGAVKQASLPNLCLALSRRHRCVGCHYVFEAVNSAHLPSLLFLLNNSTKDVDERCHGRRPLHVAIAGSRVKDDLHYQMAKVLLEHGARPDASPLDDPSIRPPLHEACSTGSTAAVQLLLLHGADPNSRNAAGQAPLHIVTMPTAWFFMREQMQTLQELLINGACPLAKDMRGFTPGQYACDAIVGAFLARASFWWELRPFRIICKQLTHTRQSCGHAIQMCLGVPGVPGRIEEFVCMPYDITCEHKPNGLLDHFIDHVASS